MSKHFNRDERVVSFQTKAFDLGVKTIKTRLCLILLYPLNPCE
jgi:hypothetical protein